MNGEFILSYFIRKILWLTGLVCFPFLLVAQEDSGVSVQFNCDSVRVGDLFSLVVSMDRELFGQFDVQLPNHPRLHVVSRESMPTTLLDGRYQQKESFILQAVSSGELVLSGIVVKLKQANGMRVINCLDVSIKVLSFEGGDSSNAPALMPASEIENEQSWWGWLCIVGVLLVIVLFGWFYYHEKTRQPAQKEHSDRIIRRQDLESIYQQEKHQLDEGLQCELELLLYSGRYSRKAASQLLKRVQKQLAK